MNRAIFTLTASLTIVCCVEVAHADQAIQNFKSFTDWCVNQASLPPKTRVTVLALLDVSQSKNCQQAARKLSALRTLNLRGPAGISTPDNFYADPRKQGQITDLTPLQSLPNVVELLLDNNQITDLSPLHSLPNLTKLDVSYNQITDLRSLRGLQSLTQLNLASNQITDVNSLQSLTSLISLKLDHNPIGDISSLKTLKNLETLSLYKLAQDDRSLFSTQKIGLLSDISSLQNLIYLRRLELGNNQISDLSPLRSLTTLNFLSVSYNQITDVTPVESLTSLNQLWLRDNRIVDVRPLRRLTRLWYLNLANNRIEDATPLQPLTNLRELYLIGNPVFKKICSTPPNSKPLLPLPGLSCFS